MKQNKKVWSRGQLLGGRRGNEENETEEQLFNHLGFEDEISEERTEEKEAQNSVFNFPPVNWLIPKMCTHGVQFQDENENSCWEAESGSRNLGSCATLGSQKLQ